jgi:hypothetical protein
MYDLGLHPVPDTNCLFMNNWLILMFFVNNIMASYSARDSHKLDEFKNRLMGKYEML